MATRVPPHNLGAEESLLGAMLLSREAIADAVELTRAEDFYKPAYGHVFEAVKSLYGAGEPADPVTVAEELRRAGLLEQVGGVQKLLDLQQQTPSIGNARRYARIVDENALLRRLIGVAGDIAEMGYEMPDDVSKALDRAESMVFEVAQRRSSSDSTKALHELLGDALDRLEEIYEKGDAITGVPTGYADLDELTAGLQPSALVIVGARPSMGKTAFGLGMASHVAVEVQRPVLYFSLEMGHRELTQRLLASEAQVDSDRMRKGKLTEQDWSKIVNAIGRLERPLYIDDNPNVTVMEIRGKARRLKSKMGDLALIVIDYLQLMGGSGRAENRQVEVSEISRGLKVLARELEVPVVALSQLSRNLEMRADKRPMLADLRESGSIEQDADVVMFLYRDEVYHPDTADAGVAEVIVAKHRNGPTATKKLAWIGNYTRFRNIARGM